METCPRLQSVSQSAMERGVAVRSFGLPYKGTAPALTDLLGGQVDVMFISLVTGAAQVRAGKLRGYGVTSAQRQPLFPDLPAIGEVVKGFESTAWFGVFAPAQLSPGLTDRLNAAIRAALDDPKLRAQLESEGATPAGMSAADFAAFVRADVSRWRRSYGSLVQGRIEARRRRIVRPFFISRFG